MDLPILDLSYKWIVEYMVFYVWSFTEHDVCKLYLHGVAYVSFFINVFTLCDALWTPSASAFTGWI